MDNYQFEPKATPQHRLGAIALDVALLLCTCYIGWIIWSLVIWGQGLTPGKQILKLRVVSSITGQTATWGHMAIRQFLIPIALSLPFSLSSFILTVIFGSSSLDITLLSLFISFLSFAVSMADALWIFKDGQNRRFTDLWAKTDVLNTSASVRN
jgi:uncharacterized RDD family membrane protein YckC